MRKGGKGQQRGDFLNLVELDAQVAQQWQLFQRRDILYEIMTQIEQPEILELFQSPRHLYQILVCLSEEVRALR